jgi:hypothetical protein
MNDNMYEKKFDVCHSASTSHISITAQVAAVSNGSTNLQAATATVLQFH